MVEKWLYLMMKFNSAKRSHSCMLHLMLFSIRFAVKIQRIIHGQFGYAVKN